MHIDDSIISTPHIFPVASLITGTTARGGGLWKYVLHAHPHGLLRRQIPLMTQVLHFLDFSVSSRSMDTWRSATLREHYNRAFPDLNYSAPLFFDSGGYKLLWTRELDLSRFGIKATPDDILHLQRDLGGDLIATLDYPLPPGLVRDEAEERMQRSLSNALETIHLLRDTPDYRPVVYVAVHGQDGDDIQRYVRALFSALDRDGWYDGTVGVAIGSLVPLRGAKKVRAIVEMIKGAIDGIPEARRASVPVHVFGMTGNLVPLLSYLGVDTFDSSTYAQEARSLGYLDPATHRGRAILEMDGDFTCKCRICRETSLRTIQDGLTGTTAYRKSGDDGVQKSRFYADIALHNLELDLHLVDKTRTALIADALPDYLIEHATDHPDIKAVLPWLSTQDDHIRVLLTRTNFVMSLQPSQLSLPYISSVNQRSVSARRTPDTFDVLKRSYAPPEGKRIALFIPCSGGKPYSTSRSHRLVAQRLSVLGKSAAAIHKVTLSGLYGPVPEEFELLPEILSYDFRLDPNDVNQIALVCKRLEAYLERYEASYEALIGYATSKSYRTVLEHVARRVPALAVLPESLKARRLSEFFRQEHIAQLVEKIASVLPAIDPAEEDVPHVI